MKPDVLTSDDQGIGLAIVRNLALEYPKSPFDNGAFLVYLTARNKERGEEALKNLQQDDQLRQAKALSKDGGLTEIKYHPLDISQSKSIQDLREFLKAEHPQGIDFVINNAGIAMNGFGKPSLPLLPGTFLTGIDANVVKTTLQCNYYGTLEACQNLLPLIKPTGRLVNVSSIVGKLNKYSDSVRNAFLSATKIGQVTTLMENFKTAVDAGNEKEQGYPSAAYAVSKAGVTGMTMLLAREERESGGTRLINACCPGYVATDMTKGGGYRTPDQGAKMPVMLALEDIQGQSGLFWQNEKPIEW